jgi:hypothetical protein
MLEDTVALKYQQGNLPPDRLALFATVCDGSTILIHTPLRGVHDALLPPCNNCNNCNCDQRLHLAAWHAVALLPD